MYDRGPFKNVRKNFKLSSYSSNSGFRNVVHKNSLGKLIFFAPFENSTYRILYSFFSDVRRWRHSCTNRLALEVRLFRRSHFFLNHFHTTDGRHFYIETNISSSYLLQTFLICLIETEGCIFSRIYSEHEYYAISHFDTGEKKSAECLLSRREIEQQ